MRKKISQSQARRWKRELEELRGQARIDRTWHAGRHIRSIPMNDESKAVLQAVKDVGCAIAVRTSGNYLEVYGVR